MLDALGSDHEFLLKGDVFTKDVVETWITYKRERELAPGEPAARALRVLPLLRSVSLTLSPPPSPGFTLPPGSDRGGVAPSDFPVRNGEQSVVVDMALLGVGSATCVSCRRLCEGRV